MAAAPAAALAAEPFSIRGFAARMRAVDAAKFYPFGGGCREGEPPPQLPPMGLPPRSRWWPHELAAERARLSAGARGREAAAGGVEGGGLRKGTKRKGSRSSAAADRAKKRLRALQFRSLLKNKEKTSKPQSTSRLHLHMLHMGLLRKHRSSSIHTTREFAPRKKLDKARVPIHENSMIKQSRGRMGPSNDMHSSLFGSKEANSVVNKRSTIVSESTNYPVSTGCEVVKHAAGSKDDIFGDLPLLESSNIMFRTGVDEPPTVLEGSFITNQSEADAITETVPLKLIHASDITAHTPSPLEDLMKNEGTPDKEPTCISHNDAARSHPSTAGIDGQPNHKSISAVKPCLGDTQLKYTGGSALSSYSDLRSKCGSSNPPQGCFDTNTNCSQEIKKHDTSSATSPPAMRIRTEATKYKDASVNGKKSTDISGPVVTPKNHLSSQGTVLPYAVSQGVFNTRTNADDMFSCRSMPAKEFKPASRPSGNFTSNVCHESRKHVDAVPLSTENQGSWYSKLHPICSPASIGLAFMKLPGLERMEISNCNVKIGENKFINEQSMNTVRYPKQQLVSGMTNVMQGQKKIGLSNSQAGKTALDGYVGQDVYHPQQPTVRLMGKTVSVCKHSNDHNVSTTGKECHENITIQENHCATISCQFPQKRLFPCQDSVMPRAHLNGSSDFLARIPNNTVSGQKTTFNGLHNKRQPINSASSTIKHCTWNFGTQFVRQAELNKASMVSANSETRHLELHQPSYMISIPQNQQFHLCTPASHMSREDRNFVGPAVNQSSPIPQGLLNASMKEKYQKSTLLSYGDPSSVPIRQPYQIPGTKLSSASIISFFDYGVNDSFSRNSSPGLCPLTASLANKSVSTVGPTSTGSLTNTDVRKGAGFADQINNRPAYADNVSQQPAKRQLITDRQDFMSMGPNMINHSLGWSLNDAVGPRILDFSNRVAGDAVQISRNENNILMASSGQVPAVETMSRAGLVAGAKTMLKPGQNLNDHSKLLYSTAFSVDNDISSVVL
ncbi:uncharacterized protein LOC133919717 [Phragmites australis]|uniref:uncharacterized protein LOC133919717 n=2 Tax=cellular organisms TaxID=131567 RepID=UPI002D794872|nr:uncharacterized protein LOC133919717 [Phragmites australis]